jgi:hypothetical protein
VLVAVEPLVLEEPVVLEELLEPLALLASGQPQGLAVLLELAALLVPASWLPLRRNHCKL